MPLFLDCYTLNMKALSFLKTLVTIDLSNGRDIIEDFNLHILFV